MLNGDDAQRLGVIPAQAGIQRLRERHWVPAFAGTTIEAAAPVGAPVYRRLGAGGA